MFFFLPIVVAMASGACDIPFRAESIYAPDVLVCAEIMCIYTRMLTSYTVHVYIYACYFCNFDFKPNL